MAAQDFELLNRAVLADKGVQTDGAGNARLARERRVDGLHAVDKHGGLHVAAKANRTSLLGLRWWRRSSHAANYATQYAAHRTTGHSARNAAHGANRAHVRLGFFLNNLGFLRDDSGLYEFACVHQMNLWLHLNDLSGHGRGRRRRGRWRGC